MSYEGIFDKDFEVEETALIKWNCKLCSKENKELARDMFVIVNVATSSCYNCGKINTIDLKTMKHVEF